MSAATSKLAKHTYRSIIILHLEDKRDGCMGVDVRLQGSIAAAAHQLL